jgi:hypothetical protein
VPGLGLPRGGGQGLQLSLVFEGLQVFPLPAANAPIPEMVSANKSNPTWIVFRHLAVITKFSFAEGRLYLGRLKCLKYFARIAYSCMLLRSMYPIRRASFFEFLRFAPDFRAILRGSHGIRCSRRPFAVAITTSAVKMRALIVMCSPKSKKL